MSAVCSAARSDACWVGSMEAKTAATMDDSWAGLRVDKSAGSSVTSHYLVRPLVASMDAQMAVRSAFARVAEEWIKQKGQERLTGETKGTSEEEEMKAKCETKSKA